MKKQMFDYLFDLMAVNEDAYTIFIDLGYPRVEEFMRAYPDRVINTLASEQTAADIAVGLAYSDKIPFLYTITPFYYRCFETIRTYINHEQLNVKMIGAGRDRDYSTHDGYSHDACDVRDILSTQSHIKQFYPNSVQTMKRNLDHMVKINAPCFISIPR